MKANRLIVVSAVLAFTLAGCGPSKAEREAKERARLQQEEQAQRDAQKANEAITEMNKKLGRKPPALDLGVPVPSEKKPQPAPKQPTEP